MPIKAESCICNIKWTNLECCRVSLKKQGPQPEYHALITTLCPLSDCSVQSFPFKSCKVKEPGTLRRPRHRREPDEQQRRGLLHGHPGPLPGHDPHRDDQCPHKGDRGRPQPRRHRRLCGKTGVGVYAAGPDTEQPERVNSGCFL